MSELPQSHPGPSGAQSSTDLCDLLTGVQSQLATDITPEGHVHSLLQAVLTIGADLDLATVLRRLTEAAAELTGARYAGLGVLDENGAFSEFIPVGVSEQRAELINRFPHGNGILGRPQRNRAPLRLSDLRDHPDFGGFPTGPPHMKI